MRSNYISRIITIGNDSFSIMCVCDADQKKKIYDIVYSIVVDFASTISGDTEKAIMSPMY